MKEYYEYNNGNYKVTDIKNVTKTEEIYPLKNNIEEILITENLIEDLEKRQDEILESYKTEWNKYIKDNNRIFSLVALKFLIIALICMAVIGLIPSFIPKLTISILMSLILSGTTAYNGYKKIKKSSNNYNKILNGKKLEMNKVNKLLNEKTIYLESIIKDKSKVNVEKIPTDQMKVNYKEQLKNLKNYLELYYLIGYNEKEYENYYNQGSIDEQLKNKYTQETRQLIKKYFEDKKKHN